MNQVKLFTPLIAIALFLGACSSNDGNSEYLRKASGKPGDVIIVMDSLQWKGQLGKEIREVFEAEVPGMPQREPMFKVMWIHPIAGKTMLREMRNLVYVFTLDQKSSGARTLRKQFTDQTLQKIQSDTSFHLSTKSDEFAKQQEVMYLFGADEQGLIQYVQKHKQNLVDYLNKMERDRLLREFAQSTVSNKGLTEFLRKEQKCEIRAPFGYKLADRTKDFVWLRQIGGNTDKDIFITWKPYTSEYQLLPDSLIAWRNETTRKHIFEDPEIPESYLITEQEDAKVQARNIKFRNHFSIELRGLWRTNTRTMGGPFLSYALVDQQQGRLYYIEGFVYAPGKDKREMLRELEVVLWTFKTSGEL